MEEPEPFLSQKHAFTNTERLHLPIWVFLSLSPIFLEPFSVLFPSQVLLSGITIYLVLHLGF